MHLQPLSLRRVRVAIAIAASGVATFTLAFASGDAYARWAFEHTTYWILWGALVVLGCVLAAMRAAGELRLAPSRFTCAAAALSLALVLAIVFGVGCHYRVLSDETNLLATSLSFSLRGTATNITEALAHGGGFHVVTAGTPSRPCLYPFLVSLLHAPLGYRAEHGFVVSAAAAFGTLLLVAALGRRLVSPAFGLLAATLTAAVPLFQLSATSCGFESSNLFFLTAALAQIVALLDRPTALRAELLFALCVLAAHCRYESAVLAIPALAACALRARPLLAAKWSVRLAAYPMLLLPLLLQRRLTSVVNEPGDHVTSAFALRFVPGHLRALGELLAGAEVKYPTLQVVGALAVAGLAWLAVRAIRRRDARARVSAVALLALGLALVAVVQTAFYLGDVRLAFQVRFATSYVGALAMLAAYPLWRAYARARAGRVGVVALATCLVVSGLSVARRNDLGRTLNAYRVYARTLAFLDGFSRDTTLVVADRSGNYTAQRWGAVTHDWARKHAPEIARGLGQHRWDDALAIREGKCGDPEGLALGAAFEQSVAMEYQVDGDSCVTVVRARKRAEPVSAPDDTIASARAP